MALLFKALLCRWAFSLMLHIFLVDISSKKKKHYNAHRKVILAFAIIEIIEINVGNAVRNRATTTQG